MTSLLEADENTSENLKLVKQKEYRYNKLLEKNNIPAIFQEKLNQTIISKDMKTVLITLGKLSIGYCSFDLNQIIIVASELVEAQRRSKKRKTETFQKWKETPLIPAMKN